MVQEISSPVTGRAFMCAGINNIEEDFVHDSFLTGHTYLEVHYDEDGLNYCDEEGLLLICEGGHTMYVIKNDFALMLDMSNVVLSIINKVQNE